MVLEIGKSRSMSLTLGNMMKPLCGETEQTHCPGPPFSPKTTAVVPGGSTLGDFRYSDYLPKAPPPDNTDIVYKLELRASPAQHCVVTRLSSKQAQKTRNRERTSRSLDSISDSKGSYVSCLEFEKKLCFMFLSSQGYCESPIRLWM